MAILELSKLHVDFDGILGQLEQELAGKDAWSGFHTTQSGQTLLEAIAAVGALNQTKLLRYHQDAFPFTALNDEAVYAIASMQGVRINRKLPMYIKVGLKASTGVVTIPPFTVFQCGGAKFFNRTALALTETAQAFYLSEGTVVDWKLTGLGTSYQVFLSQEDEFRVSDLDVRVRLNGADIAKTLDGIWKLKDADGYRDRTLPNGRLLIEFGNSAYGTQPSTNDLLEITYALTRGTEAELIKTNAKKVQCDAYPSVSGSALSNPSGGGNERPAEVYKNIASSSFGTFASAVTKDQYVNVVLGYPSVLDAACFAQREVNPNEPKFMNLVKVVVLTSVPWGAEDRLRFTNYLQDRTMYSTRFFLEEPARVPSDVNATVYCHAWASPSECKLSAENAVRKLFEPKAGMLGFDIYKSDLYQTILNSNKGIEYVIIAQPSKDLIVSGKAMQAPSAVVEQGDGSLTAGTKYYAVSPVMSGGEVAPKNFAEVLVPNPGQNVVLYWDAYQGAVNYRIWGRESNGLGLVATVNADQLSYTDTGLVSVQPGTPAVSTLTTRYNALNSVSIISVYGKRTGGGGS